MKIGMVSLGCPKNLVDSEVMLGLIREKQLDITNDPAAADLIIVNTCGFIESAKEESIGTILQMAEYKKNGSCQYLVMTGCLGQRYADDLFESMPEVDAIVGTDCFTDIGWVIDQVMQGKRLKHLRKLESKNVPLPPRMLTTPSYMAYLKIAEGCDNCCSYCIIPQLRGPYTSRPYEEVMAEARALAASGVKELIVVAQDTTRYGEDLYGKLLLPQLLRDLNDLEGIRWIRVMYLYPNNFTDELIDAFASLDKVCKYIDIPLQHASDNLLASMNRYDTRAQVETLLQKLRTRIPGITIRTTFIVGFPGETDGDFAELLDFVERQRFENAGVFQYSQEEGTVAGDMENQIAPEIKESRYHELMALQAGISEEIHRERENEVLEVLVEGFDEERLAYGRSQHEAPEIDGTIFIENAGELEIGQMVKVRILQGFTYEMVAEQEQ
ncbi:MAG: 30S ribosomal protein S12 methylthiotransferase RimO [Phascolarctobacterium sp.]|uniref:30S ribosomal protein S12 methylthiotransferase RimO n=1 Tax=Phascolarctobacterium sp. TaxID=2049039 RepID=UPI0026DB1893|nr:30S ribosomal protein S12 methylthiotransferase RimO [Phascolarctobacterium sp.]MDO4921045.1 30S ribosomal protein S12 methylthiotransferase RimO [Phascolarctobacterium sp.]